MKRRDVFYLSAIICGALTFYSLGYFGLIKRVTVQMPPIRAENGDQRTVTLTVPVFRWVNANTDPIVRRLFGPLLRLDQRYVRKEYWKPQVELAPASASVTNGPAADNS